MRHALLGLLALAGCNEIWGLGNVSLRDGGFVDGDPANPRIRLTWQITRTRDQGFADPAFDYAPLDPAPTVQIGPITGTLEGAEYAPDGTVKYPIALSRAPWRLIYTSPDGIPREVHWLPPEGDLLAHIVEPLFGRVQRQPVPASSGYTVTPIQPPAAHTLTRVFTTGIWTEGVDLNPEAGPQFDYNFDMRAQSLSGPRGAPEKAFFDHAVVADFQNLNGCRFASGVASFVVPDLVADTLAPPQAAPMYYPADEDVTLNLLGPDPVDNRLQTVLGGRFAGPIRNRMAYGYMPALNVFGFSRPADAQSFEFQLPGPTMITLASCAFPTGAFYQTQTFADPPEIKGRFPRVVHVEVASQRTVAMGFVTLTSGYSAVLTASGTVFTSDFLAPAPRAIRLHRGGAQIADLANGADGTVLPAGTGPLELQFEVELDPQYRADYFDITLYSIPNDKLDRQRVYTVTERRLTIDPALLVPGTEYVLEIRTYHGRPDVPRANFALNTFPQYAATVFTRTFRMP